MKFFQSIMHCLVTGEGYSALEQMRQTAHFYILDYETFLLSRESYVETLSALE